jgi:DNA-binding beta-propeller fold protein YncE
VFDAANGDIYRSNLDNGTVSVISNSTNMVVSTVHVSGAGDHPGTPVLDTQNGDIYVPMGSAYFVTVISEATNTVVANVTIGVRTVGAVFDPANGYIYLTGIPKSNEPELPGYVVFISTETNALVGDVILYFAHPSSAAPLPLTDPFVFQSSDVPSAPAFDPANGDIYVSNGGGDTTSVISGTTNILVTNVVVGEAPGTPAVDSANGDVYVPCENGVSVVSGSTNALITTVKVSSGQQPAFNPVNGDIYVPGPTQEGECQSGACLVNSTLSIISGATNTVVATVPLCTSPIGTYVDSSNGDVYVSCQGAVWVISSTTSQSSTTTSTSTRLGEIVPDCSTLMNVRLNPAPLGAVYMKVVTDQGGTVVTNGTVIVLQAGPFDGGPDGSLHYCINMSDVNGTGYLQLAPLYFNGTYGYTTGYYSVTLWVGYDNPNVTNNPGPSYRATIPLIQIQPYSTIYITASIPSGMVTVVTSSNGGNGSSTVTTTTTSATTVKQQGG